MIRIYADDGADERCVDMAEAYLRRMRPGRPIQRILANEVIAGAWVHDTSLLVMPGGADLPYVAKLKGAGDAQIRAFVHEHGGGYLGLCAGAYYAASALLFDAGGPLQVTGVRELALFPGTAVGPVFPGFKYASLAGSRAARVTLRHPDGDSGGESFVYFNGGCTFVVNAASPPLGDGSTVVQVVATYTEESLMAANVSAALAHAAPAAAVVVRVGRGCALLSGVHFEYDPSRLPPSVIFPADLACVLAESDDHIAAWAKAWLDMIAK